MSQGTLFHWDATGAVMIPRHPGLARSRFVAGEEYLLADVESRSDGSHRHEFAWLREAWKTLPESLAEQYPTAEHLRKRALVDAGYYNETVLDVGSNAAALRTASYIKGLDEFAVVVVRGPLIVRREPKSQSKRAMGAKDFQASKTAIMQVIADLLGVTVEQLSKAEAA